MASKFFDLSVQIELDADHPGLDDALEAIQERVDEVIAREFGLPGEIAVSENGVVPRGRPEVVHGEQPGVTLVSLGDPFEV